MEGGDEGILRARIEVNRPLAHFPRSFIGKGNRKDIPRINHFFFNEVGDSVGQDAGREVEQTAANNVIGVKETVFLRYPDGELQPTIELRRELTRLIRIHKPDVVLAGNPEAWFYGNEYVNHPDHRAAAQAACEAVFPSAGTRLIFTDLLKAGYEPHNVKRLYVHGTDKPDTWVDISETIDIKVKALQQHASQVPVDEVEKWMKDWAKEDAKEKDFEYAESYRVMILQSDVEPEK